MKRKKVLENVERIEVPGAAAFRKRWVEKRTPVVIRGLFEGEPISRLGTAGRARAALGEMEFSIQRNYTSWMYYAVEGDEPAAEVCTLAEYLEYVALNPETPKMGVEQPVPEPMRALFDVPALLDRPERALMFCGNAGNYAHLHFDGDQRQVLMYQVFGKKRVVLIPPEAAKKLLPQENFSTLCLQELEDGELRELLEYTHGFETVVRPGEAILIPSLFWHYLEYVETSLSLHLRFGRSEEGRFFDEQVHRSMYTQNVAALFASPRFARSAAGRRALARVKAAAGAPYLDGRARYRAVEGVCRELYAELCRDAIRGTYQFAKWPGSAEESGAAFHDFVMRGGKPPAQEL